jgi:signal peptidase I
MKVTANTASALRKGFIATTLALIIALGGLTPATAKATTTEAQVPFSQALTDAKTVAGMNTGWKVFVSQGESMLPQISHGTLLLAAESDFDKLTPGMLVIYRDASGDLVSHRLIQLTDAGWVVKGINNDRADPGLVTRSNLQGVVFGMMNYQAGTENLASLDAKTPIAYAKKY